MESQHAEVTQLFSGRTLKTLQALVRRAMKAGLTLRKSVEPLAAVTAPARVAAQHQSLLHFVGNAPWWDERVVAKVRDMVLPSFERSGAIDRSYPLLRGARD